MTSPPRGKIRRPGVLGAWLARDDAFGFGGVDRVQDQALGVQGGHRAKDSRRLQASQLI